MKCLRNNDCQKISDQILPDGKTIVNDNFNQINESITTIEDTLGELNIPNDYIGSKLNEKLEILLESFNNNMNVNNESRKSFNEYIDKEISIHKKHYSDWLERQKEEEETEE